MFDLWGMGIKDAWGKTPVHRSEFADMTERVAQTHSLVPMSLVAARHMVYGGIQRARELGFRLPPKHDRCTAILGPLPDGESPDMSLFGCNGKVRLVCSWRDLDARLIGCSVDQFLARPDVEFTLSDVGAEDLEEVADEDEYDDSRIFEEMLDAIHASVVEWCFANQEVPHPSLRRLLRSVIVASYETWANKFSGQSPDADDPAFGLTELEEADLVSEVTSGIAECMQDDPDGAKSALEQYLRFCASDPPIPKPMPRLRHG